MYTHSTIQDYPSISQVNLKVKQHSIHVIFAVTSDQIKVYEQLGNNIEGASSGQLSNDSSNVVELVQNQYSVSQYTCGLFKKNSLRLGHTRLTDGFLIAGEPPPICSPCGTPSPKLQNVLSFITESLLLTSL